MVRCGAVGCRSCLSNRHNGTKSVEAFDRFWVVGSEGKFSKYGIPTLPHPGQSGPSAGDRCECLLGLHPVLSIVRYPLATVCDIEQLCSWHNLANQDEYQVLITFKYPLLQGFLDVLSPGQLRFQLWTHGVVTICRCRGPTYGHTLPLSTFPFYSIPMSWLGGDAYLEWKPEMRGRIILP